MLKKYISKNKHEYNVRRVNQLNKEIRQKENELSKANGFFQTLFIKIDLRKLHKQINAHGSEVLQFEYLRSTNQYR